MDVQIDIGENAYYMQSCLANIPKAATLCGIQLPNYRHPLPFEMS